MSTHSFNYTERTPLYFQAIQIISIEKLITMTIYLYTKLVFVHSPVRGTVCSFHQCILSRGQVTLVYYFQRNYCTRLFFHDNPNPHSKPNPNPNPKLNPNPNPNRKPNPNPNPNPKPNPNPNSNPKPNHNPNPNRKFYTPE